MKITNHSNRQPIGNKLIVFLDQIHNHKLTKEEEIKHEGLGRIVTSKALWGHKGDSLLMGITSEAREEEARRATSGIVLAIGAGAFKDIEKDEMPRVGDRVTFTSYSGMHKVEGENFYRSLQDSEIHDYYIPQRKLLK